MKFSFKLIVPSIIAILLFGLAIIPVVDQMTDKIDDPQYIPNGEELLVQTEYFQHTRARYDVHIGRREFNNQRSRFETFVVVRVVGELYVGNCYLYGDDTINCILEPVPGNIFEEKWELSGRYHTRKDNQKT